MRNTLTWMILIFTLILAGCENTSHHPKQEATTVSTNPTQDDISSWENALGNGSVSVTFTVKK